MLIKSLFWKNLVINPNDIINCFMRFHLSFILFVFSYYFLDLEIYLILNGFYYLIISLQIYGYLNILNF